MIRYRFDDRVGPVVDSAPEQYLGLGRWLADDVNDQFEVVLDALEMIDAAVHDRKQRGDWGSEEYEVEFSAHGIAIANRWSEDGGSALTYGMAEAREAVEEYAVYLMGLPERANVVREYRPDLLAWQADLLAWEEEWEQPHPYRGRLGIPVSGPA